MPEGVLYRGGSGENPPGWVLLHGLTCPGEEHESLVRFAHALAATGADVLIPVVGEWKRLSMDPHPARTALTRAIRHLLDHTAVRRVGLVGFSFGCPQVLMAAQDPVLAELLSGVVGFGGYADLEQTIRFGLTGEFTEEGVARRIRPDPYGRWVVASNYLPLVPGYDGSEDVATALRSLATLAGERKIMSWDPAYDPVKEELEARLHPSRRALFRLFAPPADSAPEPREALRMAPLMADAARRTHPDLDPLSALTASLPPVRLVHGRHDHLIPYVQTLLLGDALRSLGDVRATITNLFSHSSEEAGTRVRLAGLPAFFRTVTDMMRLHD